MDESQAKEFIEKHVSKYLFNRVAALAAVVGVANIAGLVGIWLNVSNIASSTASTIATAEASKSVATVRERLENEFVPLRTRSQEINKTFDDLLRESGRSAERLQYLSTQTERIGQTYIELGKKDPDRLEKIIAIIEAFEGADRDALFQRIAGLESEIREKLVKDMERVQVDLIKAQASIPRGTIIAWYGRTEELDEKQWAVCDGTRETPDLRGMFIRGATDTEAPGFRRPYQKYSPKASWLTQKVEQARETNPNPAIVIRHVQVDPEDILPPYYTAIYIMKL